MEAIAAGYEAGRLAGISGERFNGVKPTCTVA
jgi:hypothetical protein